MQEVLDLNGVKVLTAGNDDVLLAVDKVVEPVFILLRHIAGVEPAVLAKHFRGRLRVVVVADHDRRAFDREFADFALRNRVVLRIEDRALPAVAGDADRADFVDVFNTKMDAAGAEGLGQAVVCVIELAREVFVPVTDQ